MDRAITKASNIRQRLGGGPGIIGPFPDKPPRMHWRTYIRLMNTARAAESRAWAATAARLDMMKTRQRIEQ